MTTATLTEAQSKAASGFDVTPLTADNVEDWAESMGGPLDMIEEIQGYIDTLKTAIDGYTDWSDCENLGDLIDRYENYDQRWAN